MSIQTVIEFHNSKLHRCAPDGFSYALHIRFALPLVQNQTYPAGWTQLYNDQAFALRDPIIAWGFGTSGYSRWSEMGIPDPFDILGQARQFGMTYGFAVSCGPINSRTIASAARPDREFEQEEMAEFAKVIAQLHAATQPPEALTKAQVEALQLIAAGDRHAAAAAKLGISESALKARLSAARTSLSARTTAEAIQRARDYRLL